MEITVENLQKKIELNPPQVIKIIKAVLRHEGVKKAAISFVFVTSQKIRALNKRFLNRTYATDVLAFDLKENGSPRSKHIRNELAGDIIISTDAVLKNSESFSTAKAHELVLYIVHGILHLLGYDDHAPADIKKMRAKERELMSYLGANISKTIRS